eukprot:CAMPEP_0115546226 /NCGR_PEP_ID=MMETSP0271-20121206/93020_1 /TAXON_ID=71861 /ORGANISM="Scrippsiella trochoidea, Strain CCMP3099" /LENGTH=30 /DNA_ID= /DNA_START= /DNA_END= /DNA_ORIENTATION=
MGLLPDFATNFDAAAQGVSPSSGNATCNGA